MKNDDTTPFFTVVVPTYGRPDQLVRCIEAVAAFDYPADRYELIVVDDGSPEPVEPGIRLFADRLNLTVLRQENLGPAVARNAGLRIARGRFTAFTDDDCRPAPDWLRRLAEALLEDPGCGAGGLTINGLPDNPFSCASQLLVSYLYEYYNADPRNARFLTSNNIAFPTEKLRAFGGFDERFRKAAGEDRDLCHRWTEKGHRLVYEPKAKIRHDHELSLRGLWRQHFAYGRGAYVLHRYRAARNRERIRVEPFRFYLDLLAYPVRVLGWKRGLLQVPLLAITQAAGATGFYRERLFPPRADGPGGVSPAGPERRS